jgi:hypothetical protein
MTINLALEYIPRRMCESGYGTHYLIRFRHLRLDPGEERRLRGYDQLFILIEPPDDVTVESETGYFDLSDNKANELQYEHQGEIVIINLSPFSNHVRFIQVIPKN